MPDNIGGPAPVEGAVSWGTTQTGAIYLWGGWSSQHTSDKDQFVWKFADGSWQKMPSGGDAPVAREQATSWAAAADGSVWIWGGRLLRGSAVPLGRNGACDLWDLWSWSEGEGWWLVEQSDVRPVARAGSVGWRLSDGRLVLYGGQSFAGAVRQCGHGECCCCFVVMSVAVCD